MLIAWPLGLSLHQPVRPSAPVTLVLAACAILLHVAAAGAATWTPRPLIGVLAVLRLAPDPADALFRVWQLWTGSLIHDGWIQLGIGLLGLASVGIALERQIGSAAYALVLIGVTPLAAVVLVLAGVAAPAPGLIPAIVAAGGVLVTVAPEARLRLRVWWWVVVAVGRARYRVSLLWWLTALLLAEILRLSAYPIGPGFDAVVPGFLPVYAAGLVLCLTVGQLVGRWQRQVVVP